MLNPVFLTAIDTVLGECGLLVTHIGPSETLRNLPISYLRTIHSDRLANVDDTNRWVLLIDALQHIKGFVNIVDYNEQHEKFVVGMKCKQCRANWIWNPALFQIQMAQRRTNHHHNDDDDDGTLLSTPPPLHFFDGPTMIQYQFPSRIVEEIWCRDDYDNNDSSFCRGHGYDPDIVNVPLSSLVVGTSLVANGGRGVFTTQPITKGSYIIVDDCVEGIIIPIPTLDILYTAVSEMSNVTDFWDVVTEGFVDGYGWMDNFLVP
jgi:hypothetical protein